MALGAEETATEGTEAVVVVEVEVSETSMKMGPVSLPVRCLLCLSWDCLWCSVQHGWAGSMGMGLE